MRMWNIHNAGETLYRKHCHIVELLLQLENNKSCEIMWRLNTSTCIRIIGSLCNIAFQMARFTCIVTSQSECDEASH